MLRCHSFLNGILTTFTATRTSRPSALQRPLWLRGYKNLKYKFLKIWPILRGERKSMKIWQIMTRRLEKVWKSGQFWEVDLKSMKMWQILTRRLKKYAKSGSWGSRRFYQIFILFLSCVWRIFHIYQNFILFLSVSLLASADRVIII